MGRLLATNPRPVRHNVPNARLLRLPGGARISVVTRTWLAVRRGVSSRWGGHVFIGLSVRFSDWRRPLTRTDLVAVRVEEKPAQVNASPS